MRPPLATGTGVRGRRDPPAAAEASGEPGFRVTRSIKGTDVVRSWDNQQPQQRPLDSWAKPGREQDWVCCAACRLYDQILLAIIPVCC